MITNELARKTVEEMIQSLRGTSQVDMDQIYNKLDLWVWEKIPDIVHAATVDK